MRVYLSSKAEDDLERIFQYIRAESPANAAAFLGRVEAAISRIGAHPFAARLRDDELPIAGLRIGRAAPAVLIYRVGPTGEAEVVRIGHEKQDLVALLSRD